MSHETTNNTSVDPVQKVFVELSAELQTVVNEAYSDVSKPRDFNARDSLLEFKVLLHLFLYKATAVCQSFIAVLTSDLTLWREATALLRTLLELCVDAKYIDIEGNRAELSERFLMYDAVWKYKLRNSVSNLSVEMKKMFDKNVEKNEILESEYKKYVADYDDKDPRSWSGITFTDMIKKAFKDSKNIWLYYYLYKVQCNYVHVSTSSLEECVHEIEHGLELSRETHTEDIERTLTVAITLLLMLYETCDEYLAFGKKKWIESCLKKLIARKSSIY